MYEQNNNGEPQEQGRRTLYWIMFKDPVKAFEQETLGLDGHAYRRHMGENWINYHRS